VNFLRQHGAIDRHALNERIIRAAAASKSASSKVENNAYELLNNPATIPGD
jgi:hypothetical protein